MLVEVLFSLKAVSTDGDPVVGGIDDVSVFEFAHGIEFIQHPTDLLVDPLATSKLPTEFVSDGVRIAILPDAADIDFVSQFWMAVGKGVFGKVVFRDWGLVWIGSRELISVGVVDGTVLGEEFWGSIALIVGVRESEIDQEGILGFARLDRGVS